MSKRIYVIRLIMQETTALPPTANLSQTNKTWSIALQ